MRARSSGSSAADGDSSSTFWCRRCTEHSRSPSAMTVAVRVGEHLDLDVPRPLEVALEEHGVVAERRRGLALRRVDRIVELRRRAHDPHAAAAASRGRLHEEREADLVRLAGRQHRHAGARARLLRGELVAAGAQRRGRRPDPGEPGGEHRFRELGALGEKAVAGVHGVGARLLRRAHVLGGVEVRRDLDRPRPRSVRAASRDRPSQRRRRSRSLPRGRRGRCGARSRPGSPPAASASRGSLVSAR